MTHTQHSRGFSGLTSIGRRLTRAAALLSLAAGSAQATWSIVIVDTRTGEVAVGSATCLFNFDLQANTPVLLPMIGGAAAQSAVDADGTNRVYIRDRLLEGVSPSAILTGLSTYDLSPQSRQYGIADTLGRAATFTGSGAAAWCGGVTGTIPQVGGDIIYSVQGNILTGEPVVMLAENAIRNTNGDVAARLMAGMEAARSMGGDGRCSCQAGPTACGSPPNIPWQLSDAISYMLIARDGDREGSSGVYKVRAAATMAIADFDKNGKLDIATASTSTVLISPNATNPGGIMELGATTSYVVGSGPRGVVARDFDGDGFPDIAVCNINNSNATVLMNKGDGTFKPRVDYPVGTQPITILCSNFDGGALDLVVLNSFSGTPSFSLLTGKGDGTFNAAKTTVLPATPSGMAVGDFNGDGKQDVAITTNTTKSLTVYLGDGAGNFVGTTPLALTFGANVVDAGDFDGDGTTEIVVGASTTPTILVAHMNGVGFDQTTLTLAALGANAITVADIDGDNHPDIVAAARSPNGIGAFMGNGVGGFAAMPVQIINNVPTKIIAVDLDADGDLDIVTSNSGAGALTITTNLARELGLPAGQAQFNPIGCASGDYFMEFNVLGPGPGNQDPVFVDKDLYDMWRSDRVDRPDAVTSTATLSSPIMPADGSTDAVLQITIRDWQGHVVTRPLAVTATHHGHDLRGLNASDGICTMTGALSLGNGQYSVTYTSGTQCGLDRIAIKVVDPTALPGMRPVILMPSPVIQLSPAADRTRDGQLDLEDFFKFFNDFDANDGDADLTGDDMVDLSDFFAFFDSWDGGCPS